MEVTEALVVATEVATEAHRATTEEAMVGRRAEATRAEATEAVCSSSNSRMVRVGPRSRQPSDSLSVPSDPRSGAVFVQLTHAVYVQQAVYSADSALSGMCAPVFLRLRRQRRWWWRSLPSTYRGPERMAHVSQQGHQRALLPQSWNRGNHLGSATRVANVSSSLTDAAALRTTNTFHA